MDDDVCAACEHPVTEHHSGGCYVETGTFDVCPCSFEPQPYDPSDD